MNDLHIYYLVLLPTITVVAMINAEMDTISTNPSKCLFPENKWYIRNLWQQNAWIKTVKYEWLKSIGWNKIGWWLIKQVFSFLLDGWHSLKFVRDYLICSALAAPVVMWQGYNVAWAYLIGWVLMFFQGLIQNLFRWK